MDSLSKTYDHSCLLNFQPLSFLCVCPSRLDILRMKMILIDVTLLLNSVHLQTSLHMMAGHYLAQIL